MQLQVEVAVPVHIAHDHGPFLGPGAYDAYTVPVYYVETRR